MPCVECTLFCLSQLPSLALSRKSEQTSDAFLVPPFLPPLFPEPQNQVGKPDLAKNNGEHKCEPPTKSPSALSKGVGDLGS